MAQEFGQIRSTDGAISGQVKRAARVAPEPAEEVDDIIRTHGTIAIEVTRAGGWRGGTQARKADVPDTRARFAAAPNIDDVACPFAVTFHRGQTEGCTEGARGICGPGEGVCSQ